MGFRRNLIFQLVLFFRRPLKFQKLIVRILFSRRGLPAQ